MKTKLNSRVFAISIALIIVASCAAVLYGSSSGTTDDAQLGSKTNNIFSLKYPPFLIASAQETEPMMGTTQTVSLEDEAGICAYFNVGSEINLTKARDAYKSIDTETDEYIIGIVAEGSIEEIYPRVYTRKDGWIMAYLPKETPAGALFVAGSSTSLFEVIDKVCYYADVNKPDDISDISYYNFEFPDAEKMLVVHEGFGESGTNTFNYTISNGITVYNGSCGLSASDRYMSYTGHTYLYIDGVSIVTAYSGGDRFAYDYINSTYLGKGVAHIVKGRSTQYAYGSDYIILFYKT
jgi:hypothetical protein